MPTDLKISPSILSADFATKKAAFLAGAGLEQIHADPFDFQELRLAPRGGGEDRLDVW